MNNITDNKLNNNSNNNYSDAYLLSESILLLILVIIALCFCFFHQSINNGSCYKRPNNSNSYKQIRNDYEVSKCPCKCCSKCNNDTQINYRINN